MKEEINDELKSAIQDGKHNAQVNTEFSGDYNCNRQETTNLNLSGLDASAAKVLEERFLFHQQYSHEKEKQIEAIFDENRMLTNALVDEFKKQSSLMKEILCEVRDLIKNNKITI